MTPRYFVVPWDSGHYNLRMGAGPFRIAQALAIDAEEIAPASEWHSEIQTSFELYRSLASRIAESDAFPVVFAGNCGAAIGAAAGVGTDRLSVLWFDAHGDYNTPSATESGFLDGMSLSVLTGRSFEKLAASIPNFVPIDPTRVLHVGGRDFSPGEDNRLAFTGVSVVPPDRLHEVRDSVLLAGKETDRFLVHVDLDVLDPRFGRANQYAAPDGLSPEDVLRAIDTVVELQYKLIGLVLASYDPSADKEGRIAEIAARIVGHVTRNADMLSAGPPTFSRRRSEIGGPAD